MNRIENIKNYAERKQYEEVQKEVAEKLHLEKVTNEIEALWGRAKELIDTYNACADYGIKFPKGKCDFADMFTADGIYHGIGFDVWAKRNQAMSIKGDLKHRDTISIRGGGCCHYEIDLYDGKLYFSGSDTHRLDTFVEQFNDFEKKFYEWVDETTAD